MPRQRLSLRPRFAAFFGKANRGHVEWLPGGATRRVTRRVRLVLDFLPQPAGPAHFNPTTPHCTHLTTTHQSLFLGATPPALESPAYNSTLLDGDRHSSLHQRRTRQYAPCHMLCPPPRRRAAQLVPSHRAAAVLRLQLACRSARPSHNATARLNSLPASLPSNRPLPYHHTTAAITLLTQSQSARARPKARDTHWHVPLPT